MDSLQHTGLAATVYAVENIDARQIPQADLLEIPNIMDLELG